MGTSRLSWTAVRPLPCSGCAPATASSFASNEERQVNLTAMVQEHLGDKRALHDSSGWVTWSELRSRAAGVSAALDDMGLKTGDRVGLALPTSVEFVAAYLGVLAAGAVAVPLNPNSPLAELSAELEAIAPSA